MYICAAMSLCAWLFISDFLYTRSTARPHNMYVLYI